MKREEHKKWLDQTIGGDSYRAACEKIGVSPSTISQQLKRGALSPEVAVLVAREYKTSPVDALVAIGLLRESDLDAAGVDTALGYATNRQLLAEFDSRMDPEVARILHGGGEEITPRFESLALSPTGPTKEAVTALERTVGPNVIDDLAQRRQTTPEMPPYVEPLSDDEIAQAIRDAHQLRGAAHPATEELTEPESP